MADATPDISQLSEPQQLALQQFTSVTDQDHTTAIPILQRSQWNVQLAVARFFDGDTVPEPAAPSSSRTSRNPAYRETLLNGFSSLPSSAGGPSDPAPRIVPQNESRITHRPPFLLALIFYPFSLVYRILSSSLGLFSYLFPFLPQFFSSLSSRTPILRRPAHSRDTGGRKPLNPRDTAARFIREFEEEYGNNPLPFYEGGYTQALDLAKKDLKFLLVLLFSPEHDDTPSFVEGTLLDPEVVSFITNPDNDIILWAGSVLDSEAYQISTALNCTKFPFAALISHTPQTSSSSMSVVARAIGPLPPTAFVAKLQPALSQHAEALQAVRLQRNEREQDRRIREEQNARYERSLQADRERTRREREAETQRREEESRRAEKAAAEERERKVLIQWRKWRAARLEPEPANGDATRISFMMESRNRVVRKFRKDVPIEELYAFVECHDYLEPDAHQEEDSGEGDSLASLENYKPTYTFTLASLMPRVVYRLEDGGTVGERVGRSANLVVESIRDDEE